MTSKAQYNRIDRKTKTAKVDQEELLVKIMNEIQEEKSWGIHDYIIAGNFIQDVTKGRITRFMRENSLDEIYQEWNYRNVTKQDATHKNG